MKHRCERCGKETIATIMSMFNAQTICMGCKDQERQHPLYNTAVLAEHRAIMREEYTFPGIGAPPELVAGHDTP